MLIRGDQGGDYWKLPAHQIHYYGRPNIPRQWYYYICIGYTHSCTLIVEEEHSSKTSKRNPLFLNGLDIYSSGVEGGSYS